MTIMPPSPFLNSSATSLVVDPAVVLPSPKPPDTAAVLLPVSPGVGTRSLPSGESEPSVTLASAPGENLPPSNEGRHSGAPAEAERPNTAATAGATDCTSEIHEIFYYARRLVNERRFKLDVDAFMLAIEPAPLFLQRAAE